MHEYLKGIKNRDPGSFGWCAGAAHGHTLKHMRFPFSIRKHFVPGRVTTHCHRLPEVVVECPSQRYSQTVWTLAWATHSGWPCLSRGVGLVCNPVIICLQAPMQPARAALGLCVLLCSCSTACRMTVVCKSCWFVVLISHNTSRV